MHQPVLIKEVIEALNLKEEGIIVDATIGLGGHSWAILTSSPPGIKIIGIDLDASAMKIAQGRLKVFEKRVTLVHDNFCNLDKILKGLNIDQIDGLLFDLGLSSLQLDTPERGFSFQSDNILDMRFDQRQNTTAADVINKLGLDELTYILREFGQERFAKRIAQNITQVRKQEPIKRTGQLVKVILRSLPKQRQYQKIHPATRTFQALRIYVNRELESLREIIEKGTFLLKPRSRIAVISFHSLEDRIVKQAFKNFAQKKVLKIMNKKPICSSANEIYLNPRSRSAKLRVGERLE